MCQGLNLNYIKKQSSQIIDDVVSLIKKGYYMAKVDLRHAYRSIPVHPFNYKALGLKWKFYKDSYHICFVDTQLPFGGWSAPGIFHRITQAVKQMMAWKGHTLLMVYLDDFLVIGEIEEACLKA